ncbi:hotdog fold thioesterase [Virgibacillus dakarensis]|nr:hotdog fold thioesterase [Virgibacillus dakarensis]
MSSLDNIKSKFEKSGFWRLLGIKIQQLIPGKAVIHLKISEDIMNLNKHVHGGVINSLLDSAMGVTLRSIHDVPYVTQSITTQFLTSSKEEGSLYASAKIIRKGSRIICIQGEVTNDNSTLIAHSIATFIAPPKNQEEDLNSLHLKKECFK